MFSRRQFVGGLMAGASTLAASRVVEAIAAQPSTKVSFDVPPNSCDCAVHVYDPKRFPYSERRTYTAEPATLAELRQFLKTLRLDRVVIVQATPYGTDNACVMASVRELGAHGRGVAIIDEKTSEASLDAMHASGVRGVRLNLGNVALTDPSTARRRLEATIGQLRTRTGWSLQISAQTATYEILRSELLAVPLPLVIDHFGEVRVAEGVGQRGFPVVVELVKSGKAYVKISNADTLTRQPDLSDLTPFAKALIDANPRRVVWGSAWPHPSAGAVEGRKPTDLAVHRQVDDGHVINMLPVWAPDAAMRKAILADNPARLYGF